MDLTVETGMGYRPAEHAEDMPIGVMPVDAIFTPVRRVNYTSRDTRVGQMTNYDRLNLEIETDGDDDPEARARPAAEILVQRVQPLRRDRAGGRCRAARPRRRASSANLLDAPIEELDLPMRAYNSLKRNSITKIGQLLALSDDELLRMRNFGKKSLDEIKERLALRGFIAAGEHRRGAATSPTCRRRPSSTRPSPQSSTGSAEPMPHRLAGRRLGRTQRPPPAMLDNLAVAVLRYEKVRTTEAKAKEVRGRVDR